MTSRNVSVVDSFYFNKSALDMFHKNAFTETIIFVSFSIIETESAFKILI